MPENMTLTTQNRTTIDVVEIDRLIHRAPATDDLLELADWLATNGPTHLSAIERIELAERLITRRRFLIGAGALGLGAIVGCGSDEEAAVSTTGGTHTAETPRGSVIIPANPQRVLTVYTHDLENALILGLPVIAGPGEQGRSDAPFPPYLVEAFGAQLDSITQIVHRPEINFEQLAALQPDVILSGMFGNIDIGYDKLDAIAPTVTYRYSEGEEFTLIPWREVLRQNGVQFQREDEAEDWITRFEQRAGDLRERLVPEWRGATYAIIAPSGDQFWMYGATGGHTARTLSEELGIELADSVNRLLAAASQRSQGGGAVSYELMGELDANVLFILVSAGADGTPDRSGVEALTTQALWATLPAVQAGHVHEFTGDIWYESGVTALVFLDIVEQALLG
ncbi:MAG: ABC transporter substrate-binding protein [Chloroflexota bacterium]